MVWEEKTYKKKENVIKGKGNLPELLGMGAASVAETSTVGTAEVRAVGTAEKGAKGATGMGATGVVGAGIPTPATIPDPSKVSASKKISVQMKASTKKKKGKTKGVKIHTYEVRLGRSTLLFIGIRNPLLQDGHIIEILKNVIGPFRG